MIVNDSILTPKNAKFLNVKNVTLSVANKVLGIDIY